MVLSLREKKASVEVGDRIGSVLKRNWMKWFGHVDVERKEKEDWVRKCMYMEVEGARPRGRPSKAWLKLVKNDMNMKVLSLASVDALDHHAWRRKIVGGTC